jgi:putative flippase GtrA
MAERSLAYRLSQNHIIRFVFSAGMGFLIDASVFYILYHNVLSQHTYHIWSLTVLSSTVARSISYFLGVVTNFLITRALVFNESKTRSSKQFTRFVSVAIVGFFANLVLQDVFIKSFGIYPPFAMMMAAIGLFFASYFVHKLFSFSLSLKQ